MSKKRIQQIKETLLRALSGRQGGGRFPLPREQLAALLEQSRLLEGVQALLDEGVRPSCARVLPLCRDILDALDHRAKRRDLGWSEGADIRPFPHRLKAGTALPVLL